MERLLIVEDEKMIRKGLQAIARRAPVEIKEILECKNGEEALEILKSTEVDVMFTDVRMPKMDGLTLIEKVQGLPHKPEIVMVSGYDDFEYAVEALRHGSREYLLKPVDRQRVYDILEKIDRELNERRQLLGRVKMTDEISRQQLRYMLINPDITGEEINAIRDAFENLLVCGSTYIVCCTNRKVLLAGEETMLQLDHIGPFYVLAARECEKEHLIGQYLPEFYAGISQTFSDLDHFRTAYHQAACARKFAFLAGKRMVANGQEEYANPPYPIPHTPDQLAMKIGTREYSVLIHELNAIFLEASRAKLPPDLFENFFLGLLTAVKSSCKKVLSADDTRFAELQTIYRYNTIDEFRLALVEWLDSLHLALTAEMEGSRSRMKMEEALAYIQEHFSDGLNMAVVSNQLSMNYSVFSQMFKEYTGQNFVDYLRDLRISKAKELLLQSDIRIFEVGEQVGYENDKHFMKAFKAAVGVSPTEYRKRASKGSAPPDGA